jgi:uncharacterized surface protein with fasciclin (FAS1) repeats
MRLAFARRFVVLPALVAALSLAGSVHAQTATADIVDTAVAAGQFTTLAKALQAAGLVDTLKSGGPFTVLAPTDAAFAKLPAGTLDGLLANPAALKTVLTYHVVRGAVPASQVVGLTSATPIEGEAISIATVNGSVVLNGASKVVTTDIMASNGIIHVIDSVLLPPSITSAMAAPAPAAGSSGGTTARDGQSLASQPAPIQAMFRTVWGDRAADQWVTEHNAAVAR